MVVSYWRNLNTVLCWNICILIQTIIQQDTQNNILSQHGYHICAFLMISRLSLSTPLGPFY